MGALPLLLLSTLTAAAPAGIGPVALNPALTVYLVADGQPCEVRVVVRQTSAREPERLMARWFDPEERLVRQRYVEYVPTADLPPAGAAPGIDLRDAAQPPQPNEILYDETMTLPAAGIWQLRLVGGARASSTEITLSRPLPYGVSFQNGDHRPWDKALSRLYAWIPPHAEELSVAGGPFRILDEAGGLVAETARGKTTTVAVQQTATVWTFELPSPGDWQARAWGLPLILCPTPEAARAIQASVEVLPDGTTVCHRFQRRIAELLPQLLDPAKVGRAADLVQPLASRQEAWLADPLRNVRLRDSYLATIEHWLTTQNVDPRSHWGGSLDGWQPFADQPGAAGRWDRFKAIDGLWAGASNHYGDGAAHLALAALLDEPTNPYHGRTELFNRAAAAALRDLMVLAESEVWMDQGGPDPYPGNMAFPAAQKTFRVFGLAAPHLPAEVREVWADGLRRLVDRTVTDYLTSARNQSSHYLVAYQAYANGTDSPFYRDLAWLFARRWIRGQHPSGFHQEATGPCASYLGMTHWHEAVYYRLSNDPAILESVRRSYRLFNHTVAPEPDGRLLGGFNFNHRVGEGFYGEQWSGARGILDDVVPEVGLWAGPAPTKDELAARTAAATQQITAFLAAPKLPSYADLSTPRYLYAAEPDRSLVWPALEREPFIRTFADELVAVNRPGYFASIWVGQPAAGEFYLYNKEALRRPFAGDLEDRGGVLPDMRKITPFLGGGLTGFWTPGYGHSLMAACWAPTTHHGLIATAADGRRSWEAYFGHTHQLDQAAGTLTIRGQVEQQPLTYQRTYTFADDALHVEVAVTATAPVTLSRLVENLPVVRGGWKARGAELRAGDQTDGDVTADRLTIADRTGAGVEVVFEAPQALRLRPEGLRAGGWRQLQFGRCEVILPAALAAGQSATLRYRLRALP